MTLNAAGVLRRFYSEREFPAVQFPHTSFQLACCAIGVPAFGEKDCPHVFTEKKTKAEQRRMLPRAGCFAFVEACLCLREESVRHKTNQTQPFSSQNTNAAEDTRREN